MDRDLLITMVNEAVGRKDFTGARKFMGEIELALTDNIDILNGGGWSATSFYSIYMMVHLISEDLNGAKYLWKRAPRMYKEATNTNFSNIWNVGKSLWNENYAEALSTIPDDSWIDSGNALENDLRQVLKHALKSRQIRAIAAAYSVLTLDFLREQLFLQSEEEAANFAQHMHWRHDTSTNMVFPTAYTPKEAVSTINDQLQESKGLTSDLS